MTNGLTWAEAVRASVRQDENSMMKYLASRGTGKTRNQMLILASEYIALLRNRADDIEWETGDFRRADTLRAYADEIERSGEEWIPMF